MNPFSLIIIILHLTIGLAARVLVSRLAWKESIFGFSLAFTAAQQVSYSPGWAMQRYRESRCIQTHSLNQIARARTLSKSQETIDSVLAAHSFDTLEALLVESDLPVRFWSPWWSTPPLTEQVSTTSLGPAQCRSVAQHSRHSQGAARFDRGRCHRQHARDLSEYAPRWRRSGSLPMPT